MPHYFLNLAFSHKTHVEKNNPQTTTNCLLGPQRRHGRALIINPTNHGRAPTVRLNVTVQE